MLSVTGGVTARAGDEARGFGSAGVTRKLGKAYVRASLTRFSAAVRQGDVVLPSTYTLGAISAGVTVGHWFGDAYGTLGTQHYDDIHSDLGRRPVQGSNHSGVIGTGIDGGYVAWLDPSWSLTPSVSLQYIRSRALGQQFGPMGPTEYQTTEAGLTGAATLRLDHWFGRDRRHDVSIHFSRFATSNQSAALGSGSRGELDITQQGARERDGWTEAGANATFCISSRLYLDTAASRTIGARSGDVSVASTGLRLLF